MPTALPYASPIRRLESEIDLDGSLHITIPPADFGPFGMAAVCWLSFISAPPAFFLVALCIYADLITAITAFVVGMLVGAAMLLYGWRDAARFKRTTWIDVSPETLAIRSQRGRSVIHHQVSRAHLQAVRVARRHEDVLRWELRVHNRYEWETLIQLESRPTLDAIAEQLRTFLHLPEQPGSPPPANSAATFHWPP